MDTLPCKLTQRVMKNRKKTVSVWKVLTTNGNDWWLLKNVTNKTGFECSLKVVYDKENDAFKYSHL